MSMVFGSLVTAVAMFGMGRLAPFPDGTRPTLAAAAVLLAYALHRHGRLPERQELVPERVVATRSLRGWRQFGFELGLGWRTRLPTFAPYALALLVTLLTPNLASATAIGVAFGGARGWALSSQIEGRSIPSAALMSLVSTAASAAVVALAWAS